MPSSISIILWAMNTPIWVTDGTERGSFLALCLNLENEKNLTLTLNRQAVGTLDIFFAIWCDPPYWGLQDKCCSGLSATIDQRRKSKCKYLKPKIALKSRFGILLEMAPFSSFHKHTLRRDYSRGIQNYSFWARATAALRFWKYLARWTFEGSEMEKQRQRQKRTKTR